MQPEEAAEVRAVEKRLIRSAGGKYRVASKLIPLIPSHQCYVEPFAGGAAVFFAKERSGREVLNDKSPDVAFAYRFAQRLTNQKISKLRGFDWRNSRETFAALKNGKPGSDLERFYRILYMSRHGYMGIIGPQASFNPATEGEDFVHLSNRFQRAKARLHDVTILNQDYEAVIRRFDGPDTFFFLDPPYAGYANSLDHMDFDEGRLRKVLDSIEGRFLLTYGVPQTRKLFDGLSVKKLMVKVGTPKGLQLRPMMLVSNYEVQKSLGPDVEEIDEVVEIASATAEAFRQARLLAADFAVDVEPFVQRAKTFADTLSPQAERTLEELPVLARQLRDVLGAESAHGRGGAGAVPLARELKAALPSVAEAMEKIDATGPRRVVVRMLATLEDLEALVAKFVDNTTSSAEAAADTTPPPIANPRTVDGVVQAHFIGKSLRLHLRYLVGEAAHGWTLHHPAWQELSEPVDTTSGARKCVETLLKAAAPSPGATATPASPTTAAWLDAGDVVLAAGEPGAGADQAGVVLTLDRLRVEPGLQIEGVREFFLTGGNVFKGRYLFERGDDGRFFVHRATGLAPAAVRKEFADLGIMPPNGQSGLPASLEVHVPEELRFWTASDAEAARQREKLIESQLLTDESIRVVDGQLQRVLHKVYLAPKPSAAQNAAHEHGQRSVRALVTSYELSKEAGEPPHYTVALGPIENEALARWDGCVRTEAGAFIPVGTIADAGLKAAVGDVIMLACKRFELRRHGRQDTLSLEGAAIERVLPQRSATHGVEDVLRMLRPEEEVSLYKRFLSPAQPIVKLGTEEERFTLSEVLVPNEVDAQSDIYTPEEVRHACHRYAEFYLNAGFMHKQIVNGKVVILENYVLPCDWLVRKNRLVRAGTWLQGRGYRDDALWNMVKTGKLNGLSIGGSAIRKPIDDEQLQELLRTSPSFKAWYAMVDDGGSPIAA